MRSSNSINSSESPPLRWIAKIYVHCSATPNDRDIGFKEIDRMHKLRGWKGCGYHKIIRRDGSIENGRPEKEIGAHVEGHNLDSLGVCLIGLDQFTETQFSSLFSLLKQWMTQYHIPKSNVFCHYESDLKGKTCPNLSADWIRSQL